MASSLPLEIHELIIDEFKNSSKILKSSSLVSRTWLSRCRKHLFRHLKLQYQPKICIQTEGTSEWESWSPIAHEASTNDFAGIEEPEEARKMLSLGALLEVSQIRRCIRELSFAGANSNGGQNFGRSLFHLAANVHFPALCSLSVSFCESLNPWNIPAIVGFLSINPTLEYLALIGLRLDDNGVRELVECVRTIGSLESLRLERVSWVRHGGSLENLYPTSHTHPISRSAVFSNLALFEVDCVLIDLLLNTVLYMDHLHELTVEWHCLAFYCEEGRENTGYRLISGSNLSRLALTRHSSGPTMSIEDLHVIFDALAAADLSCLTSLELHFLNAHDGTFQEALKYLSALRTPLSELFIAFEYGPRKAFMPSIDRVLENFARSCLSLKRVEFRIWNFIDKFRSESLAGASSFVDIDVVRGISGCN
ncbi:hypothetical protein D9757_009376 [Collybiopsis confluens]|uniref:F-box domain-containing protein n=1 Tax=Collybiopsis confluens TaxID=2823264 RepID=A0A8H5H784_9AGAR|nr:hypothetical protein D9757_009376 [Collybiopsis confluens]